ncbi:MAG TPA: DUF5615 family PIN-like protein [Methylomirabilota bacterium]|nr:DUF5615 family PIN-like protein [Methylomirabilota bacterium]
MKKQSAASSSSEPPELPPLFLDASLGKRIVSDALRRAGATVHVHDEVFGPGTPDETWLQRAGDEGWMVITKDRKIRYRRNELQAARRRKVGIFVLLAKNLTGEGMAELLVSAMPAMTRFAFLNAVPFIAAITRDGKITRLDRKAGA